MIVSGLFQCGDRRVGERRRRVHSAERQRGDQRQPHGAAHHDQRVQDSLRLTSNCSHPLLPVRPTGQER